MAAWLFNQVRTGQDSILQDFIIVAFDIKALVVTWHQFVCTLVISCGYLAIEPGHDSVLQVIIVTFDVKALVVRMRQLFNITLITRNL